MAFSTHHHAHLCWAVNTSCPSQLTVPAVTLSPTTLLTGMGSPVNADSSTVDLPEATTPSTGTRSPGSTSTWSPCTSEALPTSRQVPSGPSSRARAGSSSWERDLCMAKQGPGLSTTQLLDHGRTPPSRPAGLPCLTWRAAWLVPPAPAPPAQSRAAWRAPRKRCASPVQGRLRRRNSHQTTRRLPSPRACSCLVHGACMADKRVCIIQSLMINMDPHTIIHRPRRPIYLVHCA